MTEYNIAIIFGVIQIILSINLIVQQKNVIAIISEILSSLVLLFALNEFSINVNTISCQDIALTISEYLLVKLFLIGFMALAKTYSFYEIKRLCHSKKKAGKLKSKILKAFYKAKYWPKLKFGLPGMAGRAHPKTKVRFDAKGFPKFKVYYTVKLRREFWRESRERHFYMANKILEEDAKFDTRLIKLFSKKQMKELANYQTPSGYTWHHHQDKGVLQLVEEEIHAKTPHIGGYSLWGNK